MEDLGNLGEAVLQKICFQAGLSANVSKVDLNGWDAIVEFPLDISTNNSSVHDSQIECKVQVKATRQNKKSWNVSLSNLRKMATYPGVSLYLFLKIDDDAEVEKAYLVPLDNSLIWKILQRVEREVANGNANALNKKTMAVKYGEKNRMEKVHGSSFKSIVENVVGEGFSIYVAAKNEFLEKAGYEEGKYEVNFEALGVESLITFHEMSLGVDKELEISKAKTFEKRFGLKKPSDLFDGAGIIKLSEVKPKASGVVFFKESKYVAGIVHDINLFASPLAAIVPDDKKCFRIASEVFEMLVYPLTGKITYSFKIGYERKYRVKDLKKALELLKFFSSSASEAFCRITTSGDNDIEFKVYRDGGGFEQADDLRAIENLSRIGSCYSLSDDFYISLQNLNAIKTNIKHLHNMLFKDVLDIRLEVDEEEVKLTAEEITGVALFQGLVVNKYLMGVCIHIDSSGDTVVNGNTVYGRMPVRVLEKVFCNAGELLEDDIIEMLEKSVSIFPEDDNILILDFRNKKSS